MQALILTLNMQTYVPEACKLAYLNHASLPTTLCLNSYLLQLQGYEPSFGKEAVNAQLTLNFRLDDTGIEVTQKGSSKKWRSNVHRPFNVRIDQLEKTCVIFAKPRKTSLS
jgi:hypothetical protein